MEYPLTIGELEERHFYESEHGMIVIVLDKLSFKPLFETSNLVVNIANGIGSFPKTSPLKFRKLGAGDIILSTTHNSEAKKQY